MAIEIRHSGETVTVQSERGIVDARSPSWSIGVASGIIVGSIPYLGEYEYTPTAAGEVLPTRMKTMMDDLTVNPIPYIESTNESGGYTISIAS